MQRCFSDEIRGHLNEINRQLQEEVPKLYTEGERIDGSHLAEYLQIYMDTVYLSRVNRPLLFRVEDGNPCPDDATDSVRGLNPFRRIVETRDEPVRCIGFPWMITLDYDKASQKSGFRWDQMKVFQLSLREQETGGIIASLPWISASFSDECARTLNHAVTMCRNAGPNGSIWDRVFLWLDDLSQIVQMADVQIDEQHRACLDYNVLLRRTRQRRTKSVFSPRSCSNTIQPVPLAHAPWVETGESCSHRWSYLCLPIFPVG